MSLKINNLYTFEVTSRFTSMQYSLLPPPLLPGDLVQSERQEPGVHCVVYSSLIVYLEGLKSH